MKANSVSRPLSHSTGLPAMKRLFPSIETLESRIAPAALVGNVLHYTDIDGDLVTVTFSKAGVAGTDFHFDTGSVDGNATEPQQLRIIDLANNTALNGTNITVSVKHAGNGDGLAAIGYIGALNVDLGKVSVAGDLSQIDAKSVAALSVHSMGLYRYAAQGGPDLHSEIDGNLGTLTVKGDVKEVYLEVQGALGSVTLGGSLIGGAADHSGSITSLNNMGKVKIGGDVLGGAGQFTGYLFSAGTMAGVAIGGSLIVSSPANNTGEIVSEGDLGAVSIGHDIIGCGIDGSTSLGESGVIASQLGHIASVFIGGSIISGVDNSSGSFSTTTTIRAGGDIGPLTIKGSIVGHGSESPVVISAAGQGTSTSTTAATIGKITIGGSVEWVQILGGYDVALDPVNADAQIGAVKVGGNWLASDVVAGAKNSGFPNFGDVNDVKISGIGTTDASGIASKIASITIGGLVAGTDSYTSSVDHFGFTAQSIGSFKVNGVILAVPKTPGILQLSPITGDVGLSIIAI